MLKIVKKLERKYFFNKQVTQFLQIFPPEVKLVSFNSIMANTGEYRQLDETL